MNRKNKRVEYQLERKAMAENRMVDVPMPRFRPAALVVLMSGILMAWGIATPAAHAQESGPERKELPFSFGVMGGFSFNSYFGALDIGADPALGGGACGEVGMGTGSGAAFGLFAEYRISPLLSLGGRGLFENRSGAMTAPAPASRYRLWDGRIATVNSDYFLELDLPTPSLELYAALSPFSFPLRFAVGPKLGMGTGAGFEFAEELPQDNELSFENGTKRGVYASGDLKGTLLFGLAGGIGYILPMGGGFDFMPELSASFYFNSPISGKSAPMIAGVRPSVGVRYRFVEPRPDPPTLALQEPVPPPAPPAPSLSATIVAYGIGPSGESREKLLVNVERRVRRREIALLPYIFFEENSAQISPRYLNASPTAQSTVERYRRVLDLLGERMRKQPTSRVKLVGTNADIGPEKGKTAISEARARNVRKYLVEEWKIDSSRIEIAARNLPENPSNNNWQGGQAENRRVEIVADQSLLAPLVVSDTILSYSSPGLRIDSDIKFDVPFTSWEIRLALGTRLIRSLKGEGILKNRIDEEMTSGELKSLAQGEPLSYGMLVRDEAGGEFKTPPGAVSVEVKTIVEEDVMLNDTIVEVSTPILFGYNSTELNKQNYDALMRLRNMLSAGTTVTITGYADSLGESGYNKALSQRRAEVVAQVFDNFSVNIQAAGEESDMVRDDTPESRFYTRTVKVEVERK